MKRYSTLSILMTVMLVFICASASFAVFPNPDGLTSVNLYQGWWNGTITWYSCFATNDLVTAQRDGLTVAPKLSSALNTVAAPIVYIVTNFSQGPIFSAAPIPSPNTYTGLWSVRYLTWQPGFTRVPITNASAIPAGVSNTATNIVVDCPIFAVGPISNPWKRPSHTTAPYVYRIPQGKYVNTYSKQLTVPFWYIYCQHPLTKKISVGQMIIPDAGYATLADLIGANFATNLNQLVLPDRGQMVVIDWAQTTGGLPVKVIANQYPVIEDSPTSSGWRNSNLDYTPTMNFSVLDRNLAMISPEVLFNNYQFIVEQFTAGALTDNVIPYYYPPIIQTAVVNAPIIPAQIQ